MQPLVLTIAASDSIAGAGIQADIKTLNQFNCSGASVVTAITAQNNSEITHIMPASIESVRAQLSAVTDERMPDVIKIGMLYSREVMHIVAEFLASYKGTVICDPVLAASTGTKLLTDNAFFISNILEHIDLLTPNLIEALALTGIENVELAAKTLLSMGVKGVLVKGGHSQDPLYSSDYFLDKDKHFWITNYRLATSSIHGTGCVLTSAISAACARGYSLADALVIGKMYVTTGMRDALNAGTENIVCNTPSYHTYNLPWISAAAGSKKLIFAKCPNNLGLYPVVDDVGWLEKLLPLGIKTIQLRIKDKPLDYTKQQIIQAIALADKYSARLFINDYWRLAIECGAYGVHLGQEDLHTADLAAIHKAGLFLGVSSHCYYEVARAHAISPSYIACGPIFHTDSKQMPFAPQGTGALHKWQQLLQHYSLVAIGGINQQNISSVLASGIKNIALISAISKADDYRQAVKYLTEQISQD